MGSIPSEDINICVMNINVCSLSDWVLGNISKFYKEKLLSGNTNSRLDDSLCNVHQYLFYYFSIISFFNQCFFDDEVWVTTLSALLVTDVFIRLCYLV